jgi:hypothetical protein
VFSLILAINFYYIVNKLIILVLIHTNLILVHHLKYLSMGISLFLTIRSRQINDSLDSTFYSKTHHFNKNLCSTWSLMNKTAGCQKKERQINGGPSF